MFHLWSRFYQSFSLSDLKLFQWWEPKPWMKNEVDTPRCSSLAWCKSEKDTLQASSMTALGLQKDLEMDWWMDVQTINCATALCISPVWKEEQSSYLKIDKMDESQCKSHLGNDEMKICSSCPWYSNDFNDEYNILFKLAPDLVRFQVLNIRASMI